MHHNKVDVQTAIDQAAQICLDAHKRFSEAESRLLRATANTPDALYLPMFIQGCKDICTGNIDLRYGRFPFCFYIPNYALSYKCRRYMATSQTTENKVSFVL